MYLLASAFLVLSGIAALTYQVTWVRLLGLSMGSTSASISTVLAAFFLGMALGSYFAERITRNHINDFKAYIVIEALIGLSGLALLPILLNLDYLMAALPAFGSWLSLKFLLAMVLLSIPTICMGATFPVMASILIRRQSEVGLRVGQLYSLNTLGAVLGAALAGFVFIPNWGLDGAIYIAVFLNLFIAALAWHFNATHSLPPIETTETNGEDVSQGGDLVSDAQRTRALVVLAATGFVAIATQVGWTKYLAIFTGTTIYGFAAILTVFLIGIASGSWAIKSHLERMKSPQWCMAIGLVLLGVSLLLTRTGLTFLPNVYGAINHLDMPPFVIHGIKYFIVFTLLFTPTFIFGALFPLNLKLYCGNLTGVRARIGKAYAINTLASIFGAIFAGFVFIPSIGTDMMLTVLAFIVLVVPFIFLPALESKAARTALTTFAVVAMISNWIFPHISYKDLITSVQYRYDTDALTGAKPEFIFLKEGKAGVISMVTYDGQAAKVQNNGLNESWIDMRNPDNALLAETLLALVPYMLNDDPKSGFVVGFGGGITTRAMTLTDLETIRVVELEPAVVEAGRALVGGEIPALQDPRVKIDFNDARNTLLVEDQTYDVIAAQPSHPWLAGASNVFTQQFWEIVRSRLNENGVFGQWVNLFNMDKDTLRSIFQAFYRVFPHGISFANIESGDLVLFGAKRPLTFDFERMEKIMQDPDVAATLKFHGIKSTLDLLWFTALSRDEALAAAGDAEPNTDMNILSEVRLSRLTKQPVGDDDPYAFLREHFSMDLASYFKDNPADRFYDLARYYHGWNNYFLAEKAAQQLTKLDPVRGAGIHYESLWRRFQFDKAFELYEQADAVPDITHLQHSLALLDLSRKEEALDNLSKIKDPITRHAAQARLLYELNEWDQLATLNPQSDEEKQWHLLGVARNDPKTAGKQLSKLVDPESTEIPLLRRVVQYYGIVNDQPNMDKWAKRLVAAIEDESERLKNVADAALDDQQADVATLALHKLESINPTADSLRNLRRRLALTETLALAQKQ